MDHLKQVYLTKLTDDARKISAICGQNNNTRLHLTREKSIKKYTAWLSTPIFILPGVEMKLLGTALPVLRIYTCENWQKVKSMAHLHVCWQFVNL